MVCGYVWLFGVGASKKGSETMLTASEKLVEQLNLTATDAVAVHNPSNMF